MDGEPGLRAIDAGGMAPEPDRSPEIAQARERSLLPMSLVHDGPSAGRRCGLRPLLMCPAISAGDVLPRQRVDSGLR